MTSTAPPVLVSGAGAVGLTVALGLARRGIRVVVFEAESNLVEEYRASTFHPPTIEMLDGLGVGAALRSKGLVADKFQFRDRHDGLVAEFDLGVLADFTTYPYRLQIEQFALVELLYAELQQFEDSTVLFDHRVVRVEQTSDGVTVVVETPEGRTEFAGSYVVGADGGRSEVRHALGIEFEGMTYPERYLVTFTTFDFWSVMPDLAHVNYVSDPDEWFVLLRSPGLWRVLFPTKPEETVFDEEPNAQALDELAQERYQRVYPTGQPYPLVYRNVYGVHQRVAKTYRVGRGLLAGDAAHVNNPLGGMGLNGGIHDAVMLTEALARTLQSGGDTRALDHFAEERRRIALEYIQAQTAQNEQNIRQRDPETRRQRHDEQRRMAEDPAASRAYLLRTSMIEGLRSVPPFD